MLPDYPQDREILRRVADLSRPSPDRIARSLATDPEYVRRRLQILDEKGLLEGERDPDGEPCYDLAPPGKASLRRAGEEGIATAGSRIGKSLD